MPFNDHAPGAPGIAARWTSSAKSGVGTSLSAQSRVWFTLSHGIVNEVYYPRLDYACTRDFGLIVTAPQDRFFSEEKRDAHSAIRAVEDGVPAFAIANHCLLGRYRIEKTIVTDPRRDTLLQKIVFRPLHGRLGDYRLFALLAPHLVNAGAGNTGWIDDWKGQPMLFARGRSVALACGCSAPFLARAAGFVGTSDGWQDLSRHFEMRWRHDHARDGNVALVAEIDLGKCGGEFVLALSFGRRFEEAAHRIVASLDDGVEAALAGYAAGWRAWHAALLPLDDPRDPPGHSAYRASAAVIRTHEASSFPGGLIASLSIPWGFSKGDDDLGGYHLVWPRDLVQAAGGMLAMGAVADAQRVLTYLRTTQEADGHWPQNCWLDGTPYWSGQQMDECALPILLLDLVWREADLSESDLERFWPMVRRAASYIVQNGPVTGQDRWEEDGGYSPFTLAAEIAALLAAADIADRLRHSNEATYLRQTADFWNDRIEHWTYASGTPLAREIGVSGYYVRIAPPESDAAASPLDGIVPIKNRPLQDAARPAVAVISPDALALVRFGLRAPDDPRIRDTLAVIDALLKVDLPPGPCWRRYNGDGYGEHEDGRPFDGTGIGRAWPLLTGERAHYALAAGNRAEAERLLAALIGFANEGHLIPEQVWDADDIPGRELFRGRPSGSAMPLVWAHAEHVKLLRSLREGRVFDMPAQPRQRYQIDGVRSSHGVWCPSNKSRRLERGKQLRIALPAAALVHWSHDGWRNLADTPTCDSGLGIHFADLDTAALAGGTDIDFTFRWESAGRWEGTDYRVTIVDESVPPLSAQAGANGMRDEPALA
ncbi:MAG: glucan 1,4-alpha-glucosidase [Alphaproteobacteria bacterium]|nr:glucan 1,4-alpha-glucosidase [Alphaproteobacteria bacterium]